MECILRQIEVYCYLVQRGKPCALIPIQERYLYEALEYVRSLHKLNVYAVKLSDGWTSLWIYKDDYMFEVIKSLPEKPKTIFDHWVLGKAFGYSDEAIKEFLGTKSS